MDMWQKFYKEELLDWIMIVILEEKVAKKQHESWQAWEVDKLHKIQQSEMQGNPRHTNRLGGEWIESSHIKKDLGVWWLIRGWTWPSNEHL